MFGGNGVSEFKSIWVDRKNFRKTITITEPRVSLRNAEIRVRIVKAALTSNNVSYALSGDSIGYWNYYPAKENWGQVPVWGIGEVTESNADGVEVGERIWGFFPMANETVLTVGALRDGSFMDVTAHRRELPALYNQYRRTKAEPEFMRSLEDQRSLFVPLFGTSYVLYDYLIDNRFFDAKQILIGSVSSKTGFGLAQLIHQDADIDVKIVGLTSPGNVKFVDSIGCCDQIVAYGREGDIDADMKAVYVDMSGNSELTKTVHNHLRYKVVKSCMVGGTHWEKRAPLDSLPGSAPEFFFTPAQIDKRNKEWGPGVIGEKATTASIMMAQKFADQLNVEHVSGAEAVSNIWQDMLDNKVSADRGIMISIT